jgi:hypothetical protein
MGTVIWYEFLVLLRRFLALPVWLLACVLIGCNSASATPAAPASQSAQPLAGPGWTLLRTASQTPNIEGIAITPLGADQYLVSVTVRGPGADGCGTPVFTGFEPSGSTLVAEIARSPMNDTCATASSITFYVAVNRAIVPDNIVRVAVGDHCEGPTCVDEVPRPS